MLEWEDKDQFTDIDKLAKEIEEIAAPVVKQIHANGMKQDCEGGRYFFKHSKVWEIPFMLEWLERLRIRTCKDTLKIMDFGCCMSPLPPYLARRGHEVWGVDDDSWGFIKKNRIAEHYSDARYICDDVCNLDEGDFDAIISLSVFEHIHPDSLRVKLMEHLQGMLSLDGGMQMHIVDYYFPEKPGREKQHMNFCLVGTEMEWDIGDPAMCPGSLSFDFAEARKQLRFIRPQVNECRIAIGDDL